MSRSRTLLKVFLRVFVALLLLGGVAGGLFFWVKYRPVNATESSPLGAHLPRIEWDARAPDIIRLPVDYATALKVKTTTVKAAPPPDPLRLRGSLMLDANRLARVKCFFAGQVVSIGKGDDSQRKKIGPAVPANLLQEKTYDPNTLRPGDFVHKDQVLAVVWSQTVGEKKSELVDAISRLEMDQRVFDRYRKVDRGIIAEKDYDNARRSVEQDIIAVEKAERTLLSWRLSVPEIQTVRREAERIRERKEEDIAAIRRESHKSPRHRLENDADAAHWAETAILSPLDGVIVERNVTVGDVVDNTTDLFKILDLTYLQVMANAYEEDIAVLRRLKPAQMHWKIYLDGAGEDKPLDGEIDRIGPIIDPTQHTGLVSGWLRNRDRLIGEFVTATVDLPSDPTLVAIPSSALIEEGDAASVLVAVDSSHRAFAPRKIAVVQRGRETILIRAQPNIAEKQRGAQPLLVGAEVVTTGNLQLAAELANFKTSPNGR